MMREDPTTFPTAYRLDSTCAAIADRMWAMRAVTQAAAHAVRDYSVSTNGLERIVTNLDAKPSEAGDG
jgi:hypothetical protein